MERRFLLTPLPPYFRNVANRAIGRFTSSVVMKYPTAIATMIPRCAGVGGVNSKKFAVTGINGIRIAMTNAKPQSTTNTVAGRPAFSIGRSERMEKISSNSVIVLAMNQLVCKIAGSIRKNNAKHMKSKTVLTRPSVIKIM